MPLSKIAKEASSKSILLLLVLLPPCFPGSISGQSPDFDISGWAGSGFSGRARPFFNVLAVQTFHHGIHEESSGHKITVGGMLVAASSSKGGDLALVTGRGGLLPAVDGSIQITSNLALTGMTSGFTSQGDVIIVSRYGVTLLFGTDVGGTSPWLAHFLKGQVEGADDFSLKTVGAEVIRRINYHAGTWWLGVCSTFYNAGIHLNDLGKDLTFRGRLEGKVNTFVLGASRRFGSTVSLGLEAKFQPSLISIMVSVNKIVG